MKCGRLIDGKVKFQFVTGNEQFAKVKMIDKRF